MTTLLRTISCVSSAQEFAVRALAQLVHSDGGTNVHSATVCSSSLPALLALLRDGSDGGIVPIDNPKPTYHMTIISFEVDAR